MKKPFLLAFIFMFIFIGILLNPVCAVAIEDPCAGPNQLLNLLNRPTVSDSACVVPYKQAVLEAGYIYANLNGGIASHNFPEAELRFGLPLQNELVLFLPSYNIQSVQPRSGYSDSGAGIKHEIGYTEHWLGAVEAIISFPTGGGGFGSDKYNPAFNAIVTYSLNPAFSITAMFGIATQSLPESAGGERFTTVNPDVVAMWEYNDNFNLYAEVYGQTRTSPHEGAGYNGNIGVLYLVKHYFEVDAEVGRRISGNLFAINNYYGVGLGLLF